MPRVSKREMLQLMRRDKITSLPRGYAWFYEEVIPEDNLKDPFVAKKVEKARKMLEDVEWNIPGFGPNAEKK